MQMSQSKIIFSIDINPPIFKIDIFEFSRQKSLLESKHNISHFLEKNKIIIMRQFLLIFKHCVGTLLKLKGKGESNFLWWKNVPRLSFTIRNVHGFEIFYARLSKLYYITS